MEINQLPRTSKTLKEVKIQNVRFWRYKRLDREQQFVYGPLQVLASQLSNNSDAGNLQQEAEKKIVQKAKEIVYRQTSLKKINFIKSKKCMCGDCQQCFKDFTYFLHTFSTNQGIPDISAKSWCIWRKNKTLNKFIPYYGKRIHKVRQIASLTKIITSMTAVDYLQKHNLDPDKIFYQIRKASTIVGGTNAQLQIGQIYTISQLLYALMLPSGNDAAVALSEVIGLLHHIKTKGKHANPYKQSWYSQFLPNPHKSYSNLFTSLLNQKCQKLGLLDTHLHNSHGNDAFDQIRNVSTCNEIAKMSSQFMMKYDCLKTIATTKTYKVKRYNKCWENTNKLLDNGFDGIKTGITETAGPCLSACYKDYIIIVLNSKSMNQRWIQVKKLVKWMVKKNL